MANEIDWEKFITVDPSWVRRILVEQEIKTEPKLVLRVYTLQFSGQKYEFDTFVNFIINSIKKYVLGEAELIRMQDEGDDPFMRAREHFGDINPTRDGKYGELILYLLTEAILRVPLVAYKMPTNPNDQIKGGDGVFCGKYQDKQAILIGEAKTWGDLGSALSDAFKSLDKLYDQADRSAPSYEYFVAKRNIRPDLSKEDLDHVYNCFTPGTKEYMNQIKVHPVLIVFDEAGIKELNALDKADGDAKMKELVADKVHKYKENIVKLCQSFTEVSEVNLDFFLVPLKSVDAFKRALYRLLHNAEWKESTSPTPVKKKARPKAKGKTKKKKV